MSLLHKASFVKDKLLLTERERKDWETSVADLHDIDIDWLYLHLRYLIAQRQKSEHENLKFKICDACMRTFPHYTDRCGRCGSTNLREFQTSPPVLEILGDKPAGDISATIENAKGIRGIKQK
jgi:ribosomal protein L40E